MSATPRLTIATPTFGKPKYFCECVNSTGQQNLPVIHEIVGGNLNLADVRMPVHVRLTQLNPDPGMVSCWTQAVNQANTEFIGFLADDNQLLPDFSETMIGFLDSHPNCDLVFCEQTSMDANGNTDHQSQMENSRLFGRDKLPAGIVGSQYYRHILKKNSIPLEATVIRSSIWKKFGPFNIHTKGSFDTEFLYRLILGGAVVGFVKTAHMAFRWHDEAYCARSVEEHLAGQAHALETLAIDAGRYRKLLQNQANRIKGRLLRFDLQPPERSKLIKEILKHQGGAGIVFKNLIARRFKRVS